MDTLTRHAVGLARSSRRPRKTPGSWDRSRLAHMSAVRGSPISVVARSGDGVAVTDCEPVAAPGREWFAPFGADEQPELRTAHPAVSTMAANRPARAVLSTIALMVLLPSVPGLGR